MTTQNLWDASKAVLRGKVIAIILPQETRNISNKQPTLTSKAISERRTKKPQKRKTLEKMASLVNSTKHLQNEHQSFSNSSKKLKRRASFLTHVRQALTR